MNLVQKLLRDQIKPGDPGAVVRVRTETYEILKGLSKKLKLPMTSLVHVAICLLEEEYNKDGAS